MSDRKALRQVEITRAIKAAQAAGLMISELITTRDGVRVVTAPSTTIPASAPNPWDRFLTDGQAE